MSTAFLDLKTTKKKCPYFYLEQLIPPFLSSFSRGAAGAPCCRNSPHMYVKGSVVGRTTGLQGKQDKEKETWFLECTWWEHGIFFAAFDRESHGSAPTVGFGFPLLITIESTELLNSEWQHWSEINGSKPVSKPSVGIYIVIRKAKAQLRYAVYQIL